MFDLVHGYATGTLEQCIDAIPVPPECLFHDGFTGVRQAGEGVLHGVGGFFTGTSGANIAVVLDGTLKVDLGRLPDPEFYFFGVIDAGATGFTTFEFRELDGKVGQERRIFADDFTLLVGTLDLPALSTAGLVAVWGLVTASGAWLASARRPGRMRREDRSSKLRSGNVR